MNYSQQFRQGHLVLPAQYYSTIKSFFRRQMIFDLAVFLYQNSSAIESLAPSEIAQATGKTVAQVNQAIENLQDAGLLEFKTISIAGEIEMIFDALPAFEKLDALLTPKQAVKIVQKRMI